MLKTVLIAGALAALAASAVRAGHDDIEVDRALNRSPGKVLALGEPDASGSIYAFRAKPLRAASYAPNELRGWRLTVLAGSRFSSVFEVQENGESVITVTRQDGPLNGLAVNDLFIAEEIAIDRAK